MIRVDTAAGHGAGKPTASAWLASPLTPAKDQ
jgi:hypothetical protein